MLKPPPLVVVIYKLALPESFQNSCKKSFLKLSHNKYQKTGMSIIAPKVRIPLLIGALLSPPS
jgi:hypothetical protein